MIVTGAPDRLERKGASAQTVDRSLSLGGAQPVRGADKGPYVNDGTLQYFLPSGSLRVCTGIVTSGGMLTGNVSRNTNGGTKVPPLKCIRVDANRDRAYVLDPARF